MWDLLGKCTGQPVRLLGGRYRDRVRPYASLLMEEPGPLSEKILSIRAQGFRAFKIGWGPFGRRDHATDEQIVRAARQAVGSDSLLIVDAGASDAFWSNGYKWAARTATMLAG
jgi:D-galactarolactone cycloisomerase